jgi:hypothetical protein
MKTNVLILSKFMITLTRRLIFCHSSVNNKKKATNL